MNPLRYVPRAFQGGRLRLSHYGKVVMNAGPRTRRFYARHSVGSTKQNVLPLAGFRSPHSRPP